MNSERKIAQFHATRATSKLLATDDRNVFLIEGFWQGSEHGSKPIGFSGPGSGLTKLQHEQVISLLAHCFPTWSRFAPRAGDLENYLRRLHNWTAKLYFDIKFQKIDGAVFHTSAPHHATTICFQIACQLAGIPVAYLYTEWIGGRSLPMTLDFPYGHLVPLGCVVSSYCSDEDIEAFSSRAELGAPPIFGETRRLASDSSIFLAALVDVPRRVIHHIKRFKASTPPGGDFEREVDLDNLGRPDMPWVEELLIMWNQKKALARLQELQVTEGLSNSEAEEICFFSHFQPEASTFPEQGLMLSYMPYSILLIRESGFTGKISYREHPEVSFFARGGVPTRVGVSRSKEYYSYLHELGVVFDPPTRTGAEAQSKVIATVAGSIALERALLGKPTLVLGAPWFGKIPGSVSLGNPNWSQELARVSASGTTKAEAADHLQRLLSLKTITNVQGIGGLPRDRELESAVSFALEMRHLGDFLLDTSNRPRSAFTGS